MYPDVDGFVKVQGAYIAKINQEHNVKNAFTESIQQGIKNQLESRKNFRVRRKAAKEAQRVAKAKKTAAKKVTTRKKRKVVGKSSTRMESDADMTWFILIRHPSEALVPELERPLIGVSEEFTVRHMKELLKRRCGSGVRVRKLQISLAQNDEKGVAHELILDNTKTIADIRTIMTNMTPIYNPIILHYMNKRK